MTVLNGLLLALALLGPQDDPAGTPERNVLVPPSNFCIEPGVHRSDVVVLKMAEGLRVRLIAGELHELAGADLGDCRAALAGTTLERYFTREVADLDAEHSRLLARVPSGSPRPADLNNYFRVTTRGAGHSEILIQALNDLPCVETAYAEFGAGALVMVDDIPPPTPIYEAQQGYLDAAPTGYGYNLVRCLVGARGEDLAVAHLEGSWHLDHEDCNHLATASILGSVPSSSYDSWKNHGTACVGIICAERNAYGVRGMANGSQLILASLQNGAANMISLATAAAAPGDVFTSSFAWSWNNGAVQAPADHPQAEFDAIYRASLAGITYCLAAGNTALDLGNTTIYGQRYAPGQPDSGAVIVGASSGSSLNTASFSNFGARIDCHGWGGSVTTLGYGLLFDPGDPRQMYTDRFGGTSAAAPQVAGVAAVISNVVREQNDLQLTPQQIRDLLRNHGTPQGTGGHIGPRPDLDQILAQHGLPDGLRMPQEPSVGGAWSLELDGSPGQPFALFGAQARGRLGIGLNRDLLLDPATLFAIPGANFDATGQATLAGLLPADPFLQGTQLFFQIVELLPAGALHLSNSIEFYVH